LTAVANLLQTFSTLLKTLENTHGALLLVDHSDYEMTAVANFVTNFFYPIENSRKYAWWPIAGQ
jgi:hypothetical protein